MSEPTAILDACVLYPAPLRDLLMHLAVADAFRARWTEQIHNEWIQNLLASREDLTIEKLNRTRELMNANVRDCIVRGYEDLIDGIDLPDPDDRHVVAAAIKSKAETIVTFNLKDFPKKLIGRYGIEAIHPDKFVLSLIKADAESVLLAVRRQHISLRNPPISLPDFLAALERNGLLGTVDYLRQSL